MAIEWFRDKVTGKLRALGPDGSYWIDEPYKGHFTVRKVGTDHTTEIIGIYGSEEAAKKSLDNRC